MEIGPAVHAGGAAQENDGQARAYTSEAGCGDKQFQGSCADLDQESRRVHENKVGAKQKVPLA